MPEQRSLKKRTQKAISSGLKPESEKKYMANQKTIIGERPGINEHRGGYRQGY